MDGGETDGAVPVARGTISDQIPSAQLPPLEFKVRLEDVELCHRPDGSLWRLGSGGFGTGRHLKHEPA